MIKYEHHKFSNASFYGKGSCTDGYEELLADVPGVTVHKQPVYADSPAYLNGVSEEIFKVGVCIPAGPCVTDEDVKYIVECIKEAIVK